MKKYTIDFEAWATFDAEDDSHAEQIASVIINACQSTFEDTDIVLEMVSADKSEWVG